MSFTSVFYWNHQRINPFPNFPKAQLKQYFPAWLVKRFGLSESRTRQFESQGAVPRKEQPFDSCQGLHPSAVSKRVKIAHLSIKVLHEGAKPREWEPCQELRQLWPQEGSWVSLAAWRPGRSLCCGSGGSLRAAGDADPVSSPGEQAARKTDFSSVCSHFLYLHSKISFSVLKIAVLLSSTWFPFTELGTLTSSVALLLPCCEDCSTSLGKGIWFGKPLLSCKQSALGAFFHSLPTKIRIASLAPQWITMYEGISKVTFKFSVLETGYEVKCWEQRLFKNFWLPLLSQLGHLT